MSGVAGNEGVIALGLSGFAFILEIVTLAVPYGVQSSGFSGLTYFLVSVCASSAFGSVCGAVSYAAGGLDFALTFIALIATAATIAYYVLFMFAQPTLAQIPNQAQIAMQFGTGVAFILVNVGWALWLLIVGVDGFFSNGGAISAGIFFGIITGIVLAIATFLTFTRFKNGGAAIDTTAGSTVVAGDQAHAPPPSQPHDPNATHHEANATHQQV